MKALKSININDLVFIGIETCSLERSLCPESPFYNSWVHKMKYLKDDINDGKKNYESLYEEESSLYPEFAKIVCITIGKIKDGTLMIKTFAGENEKEILTGFNSTMTNIIASNKNTRFIGHYIVGFDIPFIMTRCIVNQVDPCSLIDVAHLKPWEVTSIDTQLLWKGTSTRSASLTNILTALSLPQQPFLSGSDITKLFYDDVKGLSKIITYCEQKLLSVANVFNKCIFAPLVTLFQHEEAPVNVGVLQKVYNTGTSTEEDFAKINEAKSSLSKEKVDIGEELINIALKLK